jgi:hypothetical protein
MSAVLKKTIYRRQTMRHTPTFYPLSACALAAALLVVACGGGGASPPPSIPGSTGFAVDDYIAGGSVICDANSNGVSDAGEVTTTTDSSGFFKFQPACASTIVIMGGTNIDTGLPFVGKLKAPAGSTVVTPLTTLMAEGMSNDQVIAAMGLPAGTDVKNTDPARKLAGVLTNADLMRKNLVMQQLIQKTTEMLAALSGASGDAAKAAIYSEVAASFAATLRSSAALTTSTASSQGVIADMVAAAVQRVAAASTLGAAVTGPIKALNAASVAQVVSGGLKAGADAILNASAANLVAVTRTAQSDTSITAAVSNPANAAILQSPANPSTTTLATSLTATVTAIVGTTPAAGTPPPTPAGTVLISFDEADATPAITDTGTFGGALPSVVAGPAGGSGKALKIVKPAGATNGGIYMPLVTAIPFTADRKTITARVNASVAGAKILLKVEVSSSVSVELESTPTGPANTWQTVTWNLASVNPALAYKTITILPDNNVAGSGQTYYFDDFTLAPAAVVAATEASCATSVLQCIGFAESTIKLLGFEGLISAEVADDPVAGAANKVAKIVKGPSGQPYAGLTIYTAGTIDPNPANHSVLTIDAVGLNTSKIVTVRSYTSAPIGTKMTLKLENGVDQGVNIAAETVTTVQNSWETLTFNFANLSTGVFSSTATYNAAVFFPAFSIPGPNTALTANTTFYLDELKYSVATSTPPPPAATAPTNAPTTSLPSGAIGIYNDTAAVAGLNMAADWGQNNITRSEVTIASNKSEKYVFGGAPYLYQGIDWTGSAGTSTIDVSGKTNLHLDLWSADIASIKISLIGGGETAVTKTLTAGSWNSIDIDLALFTGVDKTKTIQLKLEPISAGTLFVDNIFFSGGGAVSCGTTVPTCAPTTAIPSGSTIIYSDASSTAGLNMAPDWGQNNITRSEETIASNKSEKYVFGGAPYLYQGIDWTGSAGTTTIDVSGKGSLHLDLWSADIASIKISLIGGGGENAITKTLTASSWNSIDIDLALFTGPDKTKTIQLKLEPATAGTLYVDNVYFWGTAASGGGGGGTFAGGIYADDYVGTLPTTAKTTQGGDVGFFYDGRFDGTGNSYTYGGVSGTAQDPAGVHNFYFGLGLNAPAITDGYFGAYVKSPGNAPVNVASFTNLKLNVWGPDQLFKAGSFPTLKVVMQGPAVAGCATNSGGSEVQATFATTTQGAASIYTLPLTSFTLVTGCGGDTTVAQVLAHIAQVNVLLQGTNIQYINKDPNGVAFTNGLNIGSIKFN